MDFLSPRVQNIFKSLFQPDPVQLNPGNLAAQVPQEVNNTQDIMSGLLNPSHEAQDRLVSMLDQMPRREDYQPSRFENIMARISGFSNARPVGISGGQPIGYAGGGLDTAKTIDANMNRRYNQALGDYLAQVKPLGELADAERGQNTNARLTASTLLRDQQQEEALKSREKIAGEKADIEREKLQEKRDYMAVVKAKNEMPNAAMATDKDGKVYTWNRKTGQFMNYLTNEDNEIVHSDKLPDQQKLEIQQGNELQKIAARTSGSLKVEAARSANTEKHIQSRGEQSRATKAQTPAGKTNPNDKRVIVIDPKGNGHTVPDRDLAAFLKANPDWKVK